MAHGSFIDGRGRVPFVSGGFSETIALTQVSGFALGLLACLVMDRREDRRRAAAWLAAGLLGSLLALLVIWAAPGNETRMALMPGRQGLHIVAWRSLRNAYLYARIAFEDHWMMSLVAGCPLEVSLWRPFSSSSP